MANLQISDLSSSTDNFLTELQEIDRDQVCGGSVNLQYNHATHSSVIFSPSDISSKIADIAAKITTSFANISSDVPSNSFPTIQYTENGAKYTNTAPFHPGVNKLGSASVYVF